ncbi:MAG: hypothetical protein U0441_23095 [Polyangiaceae bacterium]
MARPDLTDDVRAVAKQLGVPTRTDPTDLIVERCLHKVALWCAELGPVSTLPEFLDLVSAKLCLHFEIVRSETELAEVKRRYLEQKELSFVDIEREFNATTDAVVIRLQNQPSWSSVRYVAVVDGRGTKGARIWFSQWHEIAHLLAEPQTKFVFRRTQAFKREPVERLMDRIAAALAFYEPLFLPALSAAGIDVDQPRLRELQEFASESCAFASLQATLHAALRHVATPAVLIEAKLGLKQEEHRRLQGAQVERLPSASDECATKLRAVTTAHNPAALRAKLFIHRNMRIPAQSIIMHVFGDESDAEFRVSEENLDWWESRGTRLTSRSLKVEAMRAGSDRVLALCLFSGK